MRPTCWRSCPVHLTARDIPRVTLAAHPAQIPRENTKVLFRHAGPSFGHTGCMLHPADLHCHHIGHIIPIPETTVSRPRSCLTVASGGPAHCKRPVNQQGQQRLSARRGQGRRDAKYAVISGLWARGAQGWRKDLHCTPNRVRDQSCF